MSTLTLPQARIPLGWATVQGVRTPVEIDMEWMLAFIGLVNRTGGTSGDENFDQYINQFDSPIIDNATHENKQAISELRNEIASSKQELKQLRTMIDECASELSGRMASPASYVYSVNGKRQDVTLAYSDVGAAALAGSSAQDFATAALSASGNAHFNSTEFSYWSGARYIRLGSATFSNTGGANSNWISNAYLNTSAQYVYISSAAASGIHQFSGAINFNIAASGTADNVATFSTVASITSGLLAVTGALSASTTIKTGGYTVATLPAGTTGMRAYVTDALAPTFLGITVGGGTVVAPVFYNGTNWINE